MDSGFNLIFDVIEVLAGAFIIYSGINMKRTGLIPSQLVGKDIDVLSVRDGDGFIKSMFPAYMICGAIFIILGGISFYTDKFSEMSLAFNLSVTGALFLTCVAFIILTKLAENRYLK